MLRNRLVLRDEQHVSLFEENMRLRAEGIGAQETIIRLRELLDESRQFAIELDTVPKDRLTYLFQQPVLSPVSTTNTKHASPSLVVAAAEVDESPDTNLV